MQYVFKCYFSILYLPHTCLLFWIYFIISEKETIHYIQNRGTSDSLAVLEHFHIERYFNGTLLNGGNLALVESRNWIFPSVNHVAGGILFIRLAIEDLRKYSSVSYDLLSQSLHISSKRTNRNRLFQ